MPTILVIEDDEATRSLLARALTREGYVVIEAADGRVAQGYMTTKQPDLVITDIVMPDCDGIEFIHYVRSLKRGCRSWRCRAADGCPLAVTLTWHA